MGVSKLVAVLFLIIAIAIGIGISMYLIPELLPFLDEQTRIIIGVVLSLFAFIALYFMGKGSGS
ncbi:hypothetical protein GF318_00645 [Candidatus Micrarchaeota archaeon]|nr:hypothetical protein [Candidatus Micrarchaeota archaeon]